MIKIEVTNDRRASAIADDRLQIAVRKILIDEAVQSALVSIAIVDDANIHALNRKYLNHDYPTDVLSFVLEREAGRLEGEIIASGETAAASAVNFGWSADDELLLYVIHGALHLAGYDDQTAAGRGEMRARERHYLAQYGLVPRDDDLSLAPGVLDR